MADQTPEQLKKQIEDLNKKLREAGGLGIDFNDAMQRAGDNTNRLNDILKKLNKEYADLTNSADYLYSTFKEITAELSRQNNNLSSGRKAFKGITDIAQQLNYQQKGTNDLTDKQLKTIQQRIGIQKGELELVVRRLSQENIQGQLNALRLKDADELTFRERARIKELERENALLVNAQQALSEGIPLLEKELSLSKQIAKTKGELGGAAAAAGKIVSKNISSDLAQYLNINEALEEINQRNQDLIDKALMSDEVQSKLRANEAERLNIYQQLDNEYENVRQKSLAIEALEAKKNEGLQAELDLKTQIARLAQMEFEQENKIAELQAKIDSGTLSRKERSKARREIEEITNNLLATQNDILTKQATLTATIEANARDRETIEGQINTLIEKRAEAEQEYAKKEEEAKEKINKLDEDNIKIKEDAVKKIDTLANKTKSLATFTKSVGAGLLKAFTDPLAILTFIIKAALKADQQIIDLGRSMGISRSMASDMRQNMVAYSRATGDSFVNTDRLIKAQMGLTEELGIAVDFGVKEQETFARLTELVGLSAKEAGKLAMLSAVTGNTTKDYVANVRKAAMESMRANRIHISDKELLKTISNLSAGILVKFQNNPKALAEAVVQAKKLGLSLEQVDKIGDSMLEWESSIEKELQAELITGRKLNFERARAAALTGDQATLMQEVANQAGSLSEYQNMNVIAQKSLAEAFGMSREEMSEMLLKQEMINKYGDKANELNAEQLKDMEKRGMTAEEYTEMIQNQQSIQENFNNAMLKLQDIIGNIVSGPLSGFLNIVSSILSNTIGLSLVLGGVFAINLLKIISLMRQAKVLSIASAAASIIKGAWASLGPIPFVGAALATAATIGGIAYLMSQTKKGDDVMSAGDGYGKRALLMGKDTIRLNNNDTVIAGTDDSLKKIGNESITPAATATKTIAVNNNNEDLKSALNEIREMSRSMRDIAKRPSVAYINGKDAFATNIGAVNDLGMSQTQNSYKVA